MMPKNMRALHLARASASSAPELTTVFQPIPQLKPGHALVRISYASIQPSDRLNAQGLFPYTTYPRIPGRDYSGVVLDVADKSGASSSWIGKSVYGTSGSTLGFDIDGTHAQYCLIPQDALVEKPATISSLQAATVGVPFTTAYICITKAQVTKNDVVLVLGANGAVGSAASQMARAIGCKQVLTAARRSDSNPDIVIGSETPATILTERVSAMTAGKGVNAVIDTVGDLDLMTAALEQLAMNGRYTWIAAPRGDVNKKITFDIFQAYRKEITMLGCNSAARTIEETAEYLRSVNSWIVQGSLQAHAEGDFETLRLDDAIQNGYCKTGQKVVIDMS
jgi:NADPH:quinone reductase-like Zn-dependent oxidoreductase